MIGGVGDPTELANRLNQLGLGGGNNQGQGNGFGIPDLSTGFPNEGISSLSDIPNITGGIQKPSLVGTGVKGNKSGKFKFLNPNKLEAEAVQADQLGYNLSDQDFAKRFPQLVAGRNASMASAESNLAGAPDPFVNNALKAAGLGDINLGTGEFTQARNLGQPIAAKEQRDRAYFQRILGDNPQRAFGLNSGDIARIAVANTNGVNMAGLGLAQGRAQQAISNLSTSAQSNAALISSLGQIAGAGVKAAGSSGSFASPTLEPGYYNTGYGYGLPPGLQTGQSFGYNDQYSGNAYDASGNYVGNSFTGEGL
jgi:hypothetical protein